MGLENVTFVAQLVTTNPDGATDTIDQGDDQIRLIKRTLVNSFPGITSTLVASAAELNVLVGITGTAGGDDKLDALPSGTLTLFQQTAAPTGWTKETTHNDKALRIVSGAASSGGSVAFSTVFGRTATDGHTLLISEMPSHTHGIPVSSGLGSTGQVVRGSTLTTTLASNSAGSDGSHAHNIDLQVNYVDLIIASKD